MAAPSEGFKHADPVKFGELAAGRGLNVKEASWPPYTQVGVWSRSPDEPKAGRNQCIAPLDKAGSMGMERRMDQVWQPNG